MGYDLHITRREEWSAAGDDISAEEWLDYVRSDPELSLWLENGPHVARWSGKCQHPDPWLDWHSGNIYTKNPDAALISKMVQIAHALSAQVVGDDGEIYQSGHAAPVYPRLSTLERLKYWLRNLSVPRLKPTKPPFQVGDRVLDVRGKKATVIYLNAKSNNNTGKVTVRYDDGREVSYLLIASGLSPLEQTQKSK